MRCLTNGLVVIVVPQDLAGHPVSEACRDLRTKSDVLAACRRGAPCTAGWHTMLSAPVQCLGNSWQRSSCLPCLPGERSPMWLTPILKGSGSSAHTRLNAAGALPQPVACSACNAGMWIEFEQTWPAPSAARTNAPMQVAPLACKLSICSHCLQAATSLATHCLCSSIRHVAGPYARLQEADRSTSHDSGTKL